MNFGAGFNRSCCWVALKDEGKGRDPNGSSVLHLSNCTGDKQTGLWVGENQEFWVKLLSLRNLESMRKMSSRWLDLAVVKFRNVQEC